MGLEKFRTNSKNSGYTNVAVIQSNMAKRDNDGTITNRRISLLGENSVPIDNWRSAMLERGIHTNVSGFDELIRSAYQIADREGKDTNWAAFKANLEEVLIEAAGLGQSTDEALQMKYGISREEVIKRLTCTPKTYKVYPTE